SETVRMYTGYYRRQQPFGATKTGVQSSIDQVEGLPFHGKEIARKARQRGVEIGARMRLYRTAQKVDPAAQVRVEEAPLRDQVASRTAPATGASVPATWTCACIAASGGA